MTSVGASLRLARRLAGLPQRALARKAEVPASTVGRIERGAVCPRLDTVQRLADALGVDLEVGFRVPLRQRVEALRRDIVAVCERYGERNVEVFGSVAAGTADDASELDLLVDLDEHADLLSLVRLEQELGELLGVEVDAHPHRGAAPQRREVTGGTGQAAGPPATSRTCAAAAVSGRCRRHLLREDGADRRPGEPRHYVRRGRPHSRGALHATSG